MRSFGPGVPQGPPIRCWGPQGPLVTARDPVDWGLCLTGPVYRGPWPTSPITGSRPCRTPAQRGAYATEVNGQAVRSHSETASYTGASREARLARTHDRTRV